MKRIKQTQTTTMDALYFTEEDIRDILIAHANKIDKTFKEGVCEFDEYSGEGGGIKGAFVRVQISCTTQQVVLTPMMWSRDDV
jgi:hypothetical protein